MSNDYRYSLCITYEGNAGQNISYRVADYDPDTQRLTEADYTSKYEDYNVFQPSIIGANPVDLVMHRASIRKWKAQEDNDQRQWSWAFDEVNIYEIVRSPELLRAETREDLINIFLKGIRIPDYIEGSFLLTIKESRDGFGVILCNKKDFIVIAEDVFALNPSVDDMIHTTHSFKQYYIFKRDIVDNKMLLEIMNNDFINDIRLFYSRIVLPTSIGEFIPRKAEDYIRAYLKWYCRREKTRFDYTRREMDHLISLIEASEEDKSAINIFFKEAPFQTEDIVKELRIRKRMITSYMQGERGIDAFLANLIVNDSVLYERAIQVIEKGWLDKTSALREQEIEKLDIIKKRQTELEQIIACGEASLGTQRKESEQLKQIVEETKQEIEHCRQEKETIERTIQSRLISFKDDIVEMMKNTAVFEFLSAQQPSLEQTEEDISFVEYVDINSQEIDKEGQINTIDDLLENLSDNLSIWFENSNEIAAAVIAAFSSGFTIVVPESTGRFMSYCLGMSVDGEPPCFINVCSNSGSLNKFVQSINAKKQKTIYVSGLVDGFYEGTISHIIRSCPGKLLWFAFSTAETVELLSKDFFRRKAFLNVDPFLKVVPEEEPIISSSCITDILEIKQDPQILKKSFNRFLKPLFEAEMVSKATAIAMNEFVVRYFAVSSSNTLDDVIVGAIRAACRVDESIEQYLSTLSQTSRVDK